MQNILQANYLVQLLLSVYVISGTASGADFHRELGNHL
jgi:hypothetical protein